MDRELKKGVSIMSLSSPPPSNPCKVISVIDADGFEVQVLQRLPVNSYTIGLPSVVADTLTGRILAVSPEAKALGGLSRETTLKTALKLHPEIHVISKPYSFDKPESQSLRIAGYEMRSCISSFILKQKNSLSSGEDDIIEVPILISGSDEFFIDLTQFVDRTVINKFETTRKIALEGEYEVHEGEDLMYMMKTKNFYTDEELRLASGLKFTDELLQVVEKETGLKCSAGIGSNKVLAKLACNLNKPEGNTALTHGGMLRLSPTLNFRELMGFGRDLGERLEKKFGSMTISKLRRHAEQYCELYKKDFTAKEVSKILQLTKGMGKDTFEDKIMYYNLSCGKHHLRFFDNFDEFSGRLYSICGEMVERIKEEAKYNHRVPAQLEFTYNMRYPRNPLKTPVTFVIESSPTSPNFSMDHGSLFEQTNQVAVVDYPAFQNNLKFIAGMFFYVPQFIDKSDDLIINSTGSS